MIKLTQNKSLLFLAVAVLVLFAAGCVAMKDDISRLFDYLISKDMNPWGFLGAYVLLPMAGFPILPFLILLGVKFGLKGGVLLMTGGVLVHLLVSFALTHAFLRPHLKKFAQKRGIRLPHPGERKVLWFCVVFMVIPGLSYAIKNYLLPLSGISLRLHLVIGLLTQATLGIPFVAAGHAAAGKHFLLLVLLFLLFSGMYFLILWLRRGKFQNTSTK